VLAANAPFTVNTLAEVIVRLPEGSVADTGPSIASGRPLLKLKLPALKLPRSANALLEFVSIALWMELPLNVFAENGALCVMSLFVVFSERLPLMWIVDPTFKVPVLIVRLVNGAKDPMGPKKVVAPEVLVISA